ncbi:thrombospondin-1-like isoform X2 [Ruditapes philippinarum]|uniref:thrombospondin-1-like isoform X2 n=1 Tax=Ruditapes philippinarum TaxID=129788 RepID=UPI00295ABEBA|nr:thrombospondin-1-like isoform X2 [Ruditapes philippinarum]
MKNTASANALSFFVLGMSVCLLYSSVFFVFRRNRVFDGYTCPESKRVFSMDKVYSDMQCALYCKGSSLCVDIFYQPQEKRCDGCRYSEDSELEIADGFLYYTRRAPDYSWTTWSPWSICSISCDSGTQKRSRECSIRIEGNGESTCDQADGVSEETQPCHKQSCPTPTLGKACTSNIDCIETEGVCIDGICFCHQLFEYNNTINNCTKEIILNFSMRHNDRQLYEIRKERYCGF